jgi:phosphatidylserine decarboxylase
MQLVTMLQYLLPHHLLSRLIGKLAKSERVWIKNLLIDIFIWHYKIDMTSAVETDPHQYHSFNSVFIRILRAEVRPIDANERAVISPVDACISQFGIITDRKLIQAKGVTFDLQSLLSDKLKKYADKLRNGNFITLYLSPSDYHRIHMPLEGKLLAMAHIPGKLFSVNRFAVEHIPQLFARNERIAVIFETKSGPMAIVMVGAMLVASIKVSWEKEIIVSPKAVTFWDYTGQNIAFSRGEEIGYFEFGSTVIIILPKDNLNWSKELQLNSKVKMGQGLGLLNV